MLRYKELSVDLELGKTVSTDELAFLSTMLVKRLGLDYSISFLSEFKIALHKEKERIEAEFEAHEQKLREERQRYMAQLRKQSIRNGGCGQSFVVELGGLAVFCQQDNYYGPCPSCRDKTDK